jgi:glycosyl transferase family 87
MASSTRARLPRVRLARTVALAVIIGIGIFNVYQAARGWTLSDAEAYWNAALRLRAGMPLYPPLESVEASDVYRYAPWFAWVTVPFTFLPIQVAGALWSAILLLASGVALAPLVRAQAWVLVALFAPILVGISAVGNVQPILIAALLYGLERRSGPVWIALAASLKVFPLLLALVYVGRRQWMRSLASLGLTLILWAPALLYDVGSYPIGPGQAASLIAIPPLYLGVVCLAIGITLALARTRFGWLAAGAAVALSLPRLFAYDVTYVMLGVLPATRSTRRSARSIE